MISLPYIILIDFSKVTINICRCAYKITEDAMKKILAAVILMAVMAVPCQASLVAKKWPASDKAR